MKQSRWMFGLAVASAALMSCGPTEGGTPDDVESTEDGVSKATGGKGDAWDWRNDPARFRAELNYQFEELPSEGASDKTAWADTYWPTYQDSVNHRWLGRDTLSPAEKYDVAFNEWEADEGFMELRPYNSSTCEWDAEYYDSLGPAADWVARYKGNWDAHNGEDDDGDGVPDAEECGYGDDKDLDGVEKWWGLCHAWVPASILEPEPLGPVERNGVTFEVADMKALLVGQYDRSDAYMIGGRCNSQDVERDDNGRIVESQCRDVNAGSFHVIVTNFLGLQGRMIAEDRTYDYEVWNQPVVGYKITAQEEMSLAEVNELLNVGTPEEDALPDTTEEIDAVLRVANELSADALQTEVGLRSEEAEAIFDRRLGEDLVEGTADDFTYADLEDLEGTYELGARALSRMLEYGQEQGWAPQPEAAIYSYNADADSFVRVEMTLEYITESQALRTPTGDQISRYTRRDNYEYILELDDRGQIIGGEWVGWSIQNHPDFLWLPTRARSGNPNVEIDTIREMIAESRGGVTTDGSYASDDVVEIPDNNPDGASSFIEISDSGAIASMKLSAEIRHTYRGDLLVALEKVGEQQVVVFDGYDQDNRWEDDVLLDGIEVGGYEGLDLQGTWRLWVVDSLGGDVGTIENWSLDVTLNQ